MALKVPFEALKSSWISVGFSTPGKCYGFKLCLKQGELITVITDYRHIYMESTILGKKFSQLNAKLSGSDELLFSKVRDIFSSDSTKHDISLDNKQKKLLIDLENKMGKRIIKWQFEGTLIDDDGQTIYLHLIRPMMDMLSFAADRHRLEFMKDLPTVETLKDPFGKPVVHTLYELVVATDNYKESVKDEFKIGRHGPMEDDDDDLPATPPPTDEGKPQESDDESESDSQKVSKVRGTGKVKKRTPPRELEKGVSPKKPKEEKREQKDSDEEGSDRSLSSTPPPSLSKMEHSPKRMKEETFGSAKKLDEDKQSKTPQKDSSSPRKPVPRKPKLKF